MKKSTLLLSFLIVTCGIHIYLFSRSQIVYLENPSGDRTRIFCLYSNYCNEIVSNGGFGAYRVTRHGQPYFSNLFYDFEILKNETQACPQKTLDNLVKGSLEAQGLNENPPDYLNVDTIIENAELAKIDFDLLETYTPPSPDVLDGEFRVFEPRYSLEERKENLPHPNCSLTKEVVSSGQTAWLVKEPDTAGFTFLSYIQTRDGEVYFLSKSSIVHRGHHYFTPGFSLEHYFSNRCKEKQQ